MSTEETKKDEIVETVKFYFPKAVVHKHSFQEYSILLPQVPGSKAPGSSSRSRLEPTSGARPSGTSPRTASRPSKGYLYPTS